MKFDYTMDDRNVSTSDLKDQYVSSHDRLALVVSEEEKVSSIESWLHATTRKRKK